MLWRAQASSLRRQEVRYSPKDINNHTVHTINVVFNHSGVRTMATRSAQALIGRRIHLGIFQYAFDLIDDTVLDEIRDAWLASRRRI